MTEAERLARVLESRFKCPDFDGLPVGLFEVVDENAQAAALLRSQAAGLEALRSLCRRAINEANGLTDYVEDRPELRSAEKRIAKIEQEFRAAIDAAQQHSQPILTGG